jgi:regulation of enolase protein 1 (concanavalin A-like superfamily)
VAFVLVLVLALGAGAYFVIKKFPRSEWKAGDIGKVGRAGTFNEKGDTVVMAGSGADIWSQADACRFASRPVLGDVSLTTKVTALQNTDPWAKAGLMVRDSLAPDSANVLLCVTANNGVALQQRTNPGAQTITVRATPKLHAPIWLRLSRHGNTFTAETSANGKSWKAAGSASLSLREKVYAGLAVCSHNNSNVCQASFEHPALALGGPVPPKAPPKPGANAVPSPAPSSPPAPAPPIPAPAPAAQLASDTNWMLALGTNVISDAAVAGRIHGQDFAMERAQFQTGTLTLRQGTHGPIEFGASISFSGAEAAELSGKTFNVETNAEKAAKVTLRWKDGEDKVQRSNFDAGYALRLEFGPLANNRLPGKIHLCLPDPEKSYLLGSFTATVSRPKPKPDQKPEPKTQGQ